jgi:hypothetical protein
LQLRDHIPSHSFNRTRPFHPITRSR